MFENGKVLCVDINALKKDNKVQKKIKLQDILLDCTMYVKPDEKWRPLNFSTTIRNLSDKLLCKKVEDYRVAYDTITDVRMMIHKGYDIVMFLSSQSLMSAYGGDLEKLNSLASRSVFDCNGLYYNGAIVDPIIYSTVYFNEELFNEFSENLADGYSVATIEEMKKNHRGNIKAILDDIVEVKSLGKDS